MRLAFVDEAGISKKEPFLVVSAVLVHGDKDLVAVQRQLDRLVVKWIPEHQRDGFVFHATELFNGNKRGSGKPFERDHSDWPMEKRLAIADDLAAIPKKYRLPVMTGWLDRSTFPTYPEARAHWNNATEAERAVTAHTTAFLSTAMKVEQWLRDIAPTEIAMMIVEDNEQARSRIREMQAHHQDPKNFVADEEARKYFPFRKIKQDPLFEKKRASSLLQIADFTAYVFKKALARDERYWRFFEPMRQQMYRTTGDVWEGRSS